MSVDITEQATLGRHETPDARLVLSADSPRSEWLAARRHGITATDMVAIMGQSSYRTAFDVWTDKVMDPVDQVDDIGEAAVWGQRLEEPVAQEWAHRHGYRVRRIGLVANETYPWALASLDRLVYGCPDGRCALEVKTRNLFVQDAWEKALPADVETQARWQLIVTGLDHVHVAALIGGQRLVEHRVDRDPDAETKLLEVGTLLWMSVMDKTPPNLPPELWTSDFLEQRHPTREGLVEVGPETVEALEAYERITYQVKDLEAQKAHYRTILVGALGEHETATSDGRTLYSFKSQSSRRIDQKALAEHYPDAMGDPRVWTSTTTRILRVTQKKGTPTDD